jgi:hypothetical protein
MSESKAERTERLLKQGLDHYGMDEISHAILAWEQVLELDPGNQQAADYILNADRRKSPRPPKKHKLAAAETAVLREAHQLMRGGDLGAALDLLRSAAGPGFSSIQFEATVDLLRSRLYRIHRERIGDLGGTPALVSDAEALTQYNLPTNAGFLLSMIDGMITVEDLISVSGMDAFEALHTLCALLDVGILEIRA